MERTSHEGIIRALRLAAGGVGFLCLLAALVGPHWSRNLIVDPADRMLAVALGALFGAMAALGPGFKGFYTTVAVIALNSLVLLLGLELGVRLVDRLDEDPPDNEVKNEVLAALPFQKLHDVEFDASQIKQFEPYVLWRVAPYNGRTVTVNARGIRETPGSSCTPDAYKIVTLGGSAMWGAGAADDQTIPAFLQEMLKDAGRPVCVTNHAQVGYVIGQNVAELVNLLLEGERPDLVISYDGYNDVYIAYEQGQAHRQFYYNDMQDIFQPKQTPWFGNLAIYWRLHPPPPETYEWHDYTTLGRDAEALATDVANHYFKSQDVLDALAAKWGFDCALFVQPSISVGHKQLTKAEEPIRKDVSVPLDKLVAAVYGRLEQGAKERQRLFYIADVFDHEQGEIWFDPVHVHGAANKIVAERIAEVLTKSGIYPAAAREARSVSPAP